MAKTTANISIDSEVKAQAQELFADLGLDLSTAIGIFLRKAIRVNAIPFEVSKEVPNQTTLAAMAEAEDMERHPEKYKRYSSFSDLVSEVLADDS